MNIVDIKNNIQSVIDLYGDLAEEHGMDGDHYLYELYQERCKNLGKAKEELKGTNNIDLIPELHCKSLKESVPSLNLKDYYEGLKILVERKRYCLQQLESECNNLEHARDSVELFVRGLSG